MEMIIRKQKSSPYINNADNVLGWPQASVIILLFASPTYHTIAIVLFEYKRLRHVATAAGLWTWPEVHLRLLSGSLATPPRHKNNTFRTD